MRVRPKYSKKSLKNTFLTLSALVLFVATASAQDYTSAHNVVWDKKLHKGLSFLTDEICQGRATGTRGATEAAFWLSQQFQSAGLTRFGVSYTKHFFPGRGLVGHNVVGMLPGSVKYPSDDFIIIGAHFDGIGTIDGRLYPGADSNASGVVALTSLIDMFTTMKTMGKSYFQNIIFVAFDAKVMNMAGSEALWRLIENKQLINPYTGNPVEKKNISLMVNIDQIGCTLSTISKDREDYIIMLGSHTLRPVDRQLLHTCNNIYGLDLEIALSYYGSENFTKMFYRLSDQKVFVDNKIPAVLFTSGITMNNNKTYDNVESINLEILRKRIYLIYHWIERML